LLFLLAIFAAWRGKLYGVVGVPYWLDGKISR